MLIVAACVAVLATPAARAVEAPDSWAGPPNTLVLALDGVPYQFMQAMQAAGYFANFHPVSRMVSPFPSMTDVAFADIFALEPPLGYQRIHYSYDNGKVIGGLGREFFKPEKFERGFHAARVGKIHGALLYVTSSYMARRELRTLNKRFDKSDATPDFYAYIHATDAIAHRYGPDGLRKFLVRLDREITALRDDYRAATGRDLTIVIFSDHGNTMQKGAIIPVRKELAERGYHYGKRIRTDAHTVSVANGIVSYLPLYTEPGEAAGIAHSLVDLDGTDAVLYLVPEQDRLGPDDSVRVVNVRGEAKLVHDAFRKRGKYEPLTGDPLAYGHILAAAREAGRMDADGYMSDSDWFEMTATHTYPDAVRRGYECFHGIVDHPSTVVVSLKPGYEFSNPLVKKLAAVGSRWGTHGSLRAADSLGVYMRTDRPTADVPTGGLRHEIDLTHFRVHDERDAHPAAAAVKRIHVTDTRGHIH